jgi:Kdo2-lipid IVA lauroyltransferase/acyltransferase
MIVRGLSHLGVWFMRMIAPWPLPLVRGMGWALGSVLYVLVRGRRKIVHVNLALCFPTHSVQQRRAMARQVFIHFAQTWLDRSWLWHGTPQQLAQRLHLTGDLQALRDEPRVILFCPHFMGLDAGGVAITLNQLRVSCSIFASQSNPVVDDWIYKGRTRFGGARLFARREGVREIAQAVKSGEALYLLPDLDFGALGAEFVPFFGVTAATVTSLSRFSLLSKARVITVFNRITPSGYDVNFSAPWPNFPTRDAHADTARMNQELEALVQQAPDQYYWVHKRFKTRPPGERRYY